VITADNRQARKARYQSVLNVVAEKTTDSHATPGVRPTHLATTLCSTAGRMDRDALDTTLQAANENDDIVGWTDAEGKLRVTLATVPDLRRLATHLAEEVQDPEQLGRINTMLKEVRDD